jgi:hypothetical protein
MRTRDQAERDHEIAFVLFVAIWAIMVLAG